MSETAKGTCYEDAARYILKDREGILVHGTVQHITREGVSRTGHAWVELPDDTIWEPHTKTILTKEQFAAAKPEEIARYDFVQMARNLVKRKHFGPWVTQIIDSPNTPKTEAQLQTEQPELLGTPMGADIYPLTLTMEDYKQKWQPEGWKIIFIGPTSTWRQDWGSWEAIRDIVQNCLDEAEAYQWGYDDLGLWIADHGKGVAVADFLLGPPKLKPDWARGKFGEGLKIACLAMIRDGYPVKIETVARELYIIFLEQEVNGTAKSLAALWKSNGTQIGTKFHFIGYRGDAYADRFAVNLPRELILFSAPSQITEPHQRYNQLIRTNVPLFTSPRIYARDIFMRETTTLYSYNLWSFQLAPDRFAPASEDDMWRDVGRLWSCVDQPDLLENLIKMITMPPLLQAEESGKIQLGWLGTNPVTGVDYHRTLIQNKSIWQQAWNNSIGDNVVLRTREEWDPIVTHLGYQSQSVIWNVHEALGDVIKSDKGLIDESQERLREVQIIPDNQLPPRELASLHLARGIVEDLIAFGTVGGIHAAIIPPASDRVRTAGMYGRSTQEIFIAQAQLKLGKNTVDTTIHELAHHTTGAEDGEERHNAELSRLGGLIVSRVAEGRYDRLLQDLDFQW